MKDTPYQQVKFNVADNIKKRLIELNMTQRELAKELDSYESEISKYISGNQNFTIKTLIRLYDILKISLTDILDSAKPLNPTWEQVKKLEDNYSKQHETESPKEENTVELSSDDNIKLLLRKLWSGTAQAGVMREQFVRDGIPIIKTYLSTPSTNCKGEWESPEKPPEDHTDILIKYCRPQSRNFPHAEYVTQSSYYNDEFETLKEGDEVLGWVNIDVLPPSNKGENKK